MSKINIPLRIALLDDDFYALKWNTALAMRDPRTTITIEAETPSQLINTIKQKSPPDVTIVDVEYAPDKMELDELLEKIKTNCQRLCGSKVCLSGSGSAMVIPGAVPNEKFLRLQETLKHEYNCESRFVYNNRW